MRALLLAFVASGLVGANVRADTPTSEGEAVREAALLDRMCSAGEARACLQLGEVAQREYTILRSGYHHRADNVVASKAFGAALRALEPRCRNGDANACDRIAGVYLGPALDDRALRSEFLERACHLGRAESCHRRGEEERRRRPGLALRWYAAACRKGYRDSCGTLPATILAALALEPSPPEIDEAFGATVRTLPAFDNDRDWADDLTLARATVLLWRGNRRKALDAFAAFTRRFATKPVPEHMLRSIIFANVGLLSAADGIDANAVATAYVALCALCPMKGSAYKTQMLAADYSWVDPRPMLERARLVMDRNAPQR